MIYRLFRWLMHKHCWSWHRNIHGDEIIALGGMRSEWRCSSCGKWKLMPHLYRTKQSIPRAVREATQAGVPQ